MMHSIKIYYLSHSLHDNFKCLSFDVFFTEILYADEIKLFTKFLLLEVDLKYFFRQTRNFLKFEFT